MKSCRRLAAGDEHAWPAKWEQGWLQAARCPGASARSALVTAWKFISTVHAACQIGGECPGTRAPHKPDTMKLDVNVLRYLSKDEFRVLTAVEMGQKNVGMEWRGGWDCCPAARSTTAWSPTASSLSPHLHTLPPPNSSSPFPAPCSTRLCPPALSTRLPGSSESGGVLYRPERMRRLRSGVLGNARRRVSLAATPSPSHSPPCRHGGAHKCLKELLRHKLVHHESKK